MVLNVVGSNPTGHPEEEVKRLPLFLYSGVRTYGFVIDEVAELQRRIPLGTLKRKLKGFLFLYSGVRTLGFVIDEVGLTIKSSKRCLNED